MAKSDEGFEAWLAKVDRIIEERVGLSLRDLVDCPYRDWYNDGKTAAAAARKAIKTESE